MARRYFAELNEQNVEQLRAEAGRAGDSKAVSDCAKVLNWIAAGKKRRCSAADRVIKLIDAAKAQAAE